MKRQTASMMAIFRDIITNEGPANLYRGILSPILAEAPKRAIKFSLNETYKGMLRKDDGSLPAARAAAAGSLAGMTECSVNTPFEVRSLTTGRQAAASSARHQSHGARGPAPRWSAGDTVPLPTKRLAAPAAATIGCPPRSCFAPGFFSRLFREILSGSGSGSVRA